MGYHLTSSGCEAGCTSKTAYPRLARCEAGLRFFTTSQGRWLSRDPIGEEGGVNQFAICENEVIAWVDVYGLVRCGRWMNVTSYSDAKKNVSDPRVGRPPRAGTIAVADTSSRIDANGGTYRVDSQGRRLTIEERKSGRYPAVPAYPYGTQFDVYRYKRGGAKEEVYSGTVEDTGKGHLYERPQSEDTAETAGDASAWIDVWTKDPSDAKDFGVQHLWVEFESGTECCPSGWSSL